MKRARSVIATYDLVSDRYVSVLPVRDHIETGTGHSAGLQGLHSEFYVIDESSGVDDSIWDSTQFIEAARVNTNPKPSLSKPKRKSKRVLGRKAMQRY